MSNDVESVFRAVDRWTATLALESVPIGELFGRVTAAMIRARRDMPRTDISALDGFVVEGPGPVFVQSGFQEMGKRPGKVKEGRALFVPTGAPLPTNGRFVRREHAGEEAGAVTVRTEGDERKEWGKGSWLKKGDLVIGRGRRVTAAIMEKLALSGASHAEVIRRPRVGVMVTGDEIYSGVVPDSNRYLLSGLLQRDGAVVHHVPTVPDRTEEMAQAIENEAVIDLLVLTGGTAKGKKDITREALKRAGARFIVDGRPLFPGRTMAFGLLGSMPFFLLPGNPRPLRTLYELFVARCLARLHGIREPLFVPVEINCPQLIAKETGVTKIIPLSLGGFPPGDKLVLYADDPDGFLVLDRKTEGVRENERIRALWSRKRYPSCLSWADRTPGKPPSS